MESCHLCGTIFVFMFYNKSQDYLQMGSCGSGIYMLTIFYCLFFLYLFQFVLSILALPFKYCRYRISLFSRWKQRGMYATCMWVVELLLVLSNTDSIFCFVPEFYLESLVNVILLYIAIFR